MAEPWERQRDEDGNLEPNFWYDRFDRLYRPQGSERSLLRAYNGWRMEAQKGDERRSLPNSWFKNAKRWHWKERAEAWDAEQRRLRGIVEEEARAEMLRRHITVGRAMQGLGGRKLKEITDEDDLGVLSPTEARLYLKDGTAIERTARGLPEHLVAIAEMTDDELIAKYAGLLAGIGDAGSGDGAEGNRTASDDDS